MDEKPRDDDDVARLFRESDDVGPDSSLWLRPLRQLFEQGKPVGQVIALTVSLPEPLGSVFGMLTSTENQRLIFWPVLPPEATVICDGEAVHVLDHITLELPSEKTHATAYDAQGRSVHQSRSTRLRRPPDSSLALWFNLLVRVDVLRRQAVAVQRRVPMPTSDRERREQEFRRYAERFAFAHVELPPHESACDYIYFGVCLAPDAASAGQLSPSVLPADARMDSLIEGWPEGNVFPISGSSLTFDRWTVCIATACPPGRLSSDLVVGFPRTSISG
jgi:hypothetical protein